MPAEAPADVQAAVAPHLTSLGVPTSLQPLFFQALAAAGYTVIGEEASEPAEVTEAVTCDRKQIEGVPGAFLVIGCLVRPSVTVI